MHNILRTKSKKNHVFSRGAEGSTRRVRKTLVEKKKKLKNSPGEQLRKLSTVIQSWGSPLRFNAQPNEDGDSDPFVSRPNFRVASEVEKYGSIIEPTFVPAMAKDLRPKNEEDCRLVIDQVAESFEQRMVKAHNEKDAFEGVCAPVISVNEYLFRLVKYMDKWYKETTHFRSVGMRTLFLSVVYIEHLQDILPDFELNIYNVHRLFLISMLIAAKYTEDYPISNKYWAKVGGISKEQVNNLESVFCCMSEFNLYVADDELKTLYDEYKPPSVIKPAE
uniref:Cyclin-like domain-containing protein n=1 Tax=Aplanochytrium stocchinoi TaxID=215587 RepID=A0A7S3PL70_9STRA|mmetsp:Transcript_22903/g.29240  ORF Transcript_22903/g.29240 Transcript_22903/m.29240 type:complete len:277 (+) Transcript_22903:129-959(+)|eukprot:CAMPEP_0204871214 /NCGR_PEP_ID=MMETSP1348-20121228/34615_1 /ASSEMBLY_ACC=CAM_ASM_000700 /TAXON_ID=215587 /ORGANISM="Aplanochytrium stocchinoi, Strain GSBS06" /LENGTH=276 /DNA_ID=CAMNT_0052025375 /DNA_START=100 /DNA_END=930 /DNA_ORIENTATION=-